VAALLVVVAWLSIGLRRRRKEGGTKEKEEGEEERQLQSSLSMQSSGKTRGARADYELAHDGLWW